MSRRHRAVRTASCILAGALALMVLPAPVTLAGSERSPCRVRNVTQGTSSSSIRVVVTLAHDGDRLQVRGTCYPRGLAIDKDLVIRGMGDRATLDGQARYRVLRIAKGAVVTLRHLVLTHGRPRSGFFAQGGGINNRGTLTLIDSLVTENDGAYTGGGIYNFGTLTLIRSRVSGHGNGYPDDEGSTIQGMGGGIFNSGTATLDHSVVSDNHTDYDGGGIKNTGTMTLRASRVSGNSSDYGAPGGTGPGSGGIVNTGTLILVDSRVTGNAGDLGAGIGNTGFVRLIGSIVSGNSGWLRGGGIFNSRRGTVILTGGSRVTGNSSGGPAVECAQRRGTLDGCWPASGVGGGVFNRGSLTLRDTTVTGNEAGVRGGGLYDSASGTVTLRGTASVTGNTPDDCVGTPAC